MATKTVKKAAKKAPVTKTTDTFLTLRLERKVVKALDALARTERRTRPQVIRMALEDAVAKGKARG